MPQGTIAIAIRRRKVRNVRMGQKVKSGSNFPRKSGYEVCLFFLEC